MARGIMSDETKYELAEELGFAHKVKDGDWGNITTREAGSLVKAAIEKAEGQMAVERSGSMVNTPVDQRIVNRPVNRMMNSYPVVNENKMTRQNKQ